MVPEKKFDTCLSPLVPKARKQNCVPPYCQPQTCEGEGGPGGGGPLLLWLSAVLIHPCPHPNKEDCHALKRSLTAPHAPANAPPPKKMSQEHKQKPHGDGPIRSPKGAPRSLYFAPAEGQGHVSPLTTNACGARTHSARKGAYHSGAQGPEHRGRDVDICKAWHAVHHRTPNSLCPDGCTGPQGGERADAVPRIRDGYRERGGGSEPPPPPN